MLTLQANFEVYCKCGEELTRMSKVDSPVFYYNKKIQVINVIVDPCLKCIEVAIKNSKEGI